MLKVICSILTIHFSAEAARILAVFPVPSISHQVVFRPLIHELAKRGHDVTVLTPDPAFPKGLENFTEIDVHDLSYTMWRDTFVKTATGKKQDLVTQVTVAFEVISKIFVEQLKTDEMQRILNDKDKEFDLLLLEACVRPALVLSHIFKVPVIQVSSFGGMFENFETIGAPTHPIMYPSPLRQRIYNLTLWEKVVELYTYYKLQKMYYASENEENRILREIFGSNIPALSDLTKNVHMLFLNMHIVWDGNRPVPPAVVYMGGLHQKPLKALPVDLSTYLNSSTNGVIYISFGTNVNPSTLPSEKIQIFLNVFSRLPYNVLWKWDSEELQGISSNIRISKWFPQSDLLNHPNIKLFITQGGLQSTDEAITAGVPLIGIPMLGDQWFNTEQYVFHHIGVKLDLDTLCDEQLMNAINTVIGDESYRRNIVRLRSLMRDQPQSPLERAVWWTEHVLRHRGAKHLRAPAANISWTQYLELDFFATIVLLVSVPLMILYFMMKKFLTAPRILKAKIA